MSRLAAIFVLLLWPPMAFSDELVTDLSDHSISITSNFQGADLLLFGAIQQDGKEGPLNKSSDIIVVVRGPDIPISVRQKERIAGFWINRDSLEFPSVPSFYAVLSSRPLRDIGSAALLTRHRIGAEFLDLRPANENAPKDSVDAFRQAILRARERDGLYIIDENAITFLGDTLFRTDVRFPVNVPVGDYRAETYLLQDGRVVSAQATPLYINKSGIERRIFMMAHNQPVLYGFIAVLMAVLAGWLAAGIFRRN